MWVSGVYRSRIGFVLFFASYVVVRETCLLLSHAAAVWDFVSGVMCLRARLEEESSSRWGDSCRDHLLNRAGGSCKKKHKNKTMMLQNTHTLIDEHTHICVEMQTKGNF